MDLRGLLRTNVASRNFYPFVGLFCLQQPRWRKGGCETLTEEMQTPIALQRYGVVPLLSLLRSNSYEHHIAMKSPPCVSYFVTICVLVNGG